MSENKPVGRPTKYNPIYCDIAEAILAMDKPLCEVAANLDVSEDTIYEWLKVYPEFSESVNKGRAKGKKVFMENVRLASWDADTHKVNNGLITLLAVNKYKMTTTRSDNKSDINHSGTLNLADAIRQRDVKTGK